MDRIRTLSKPNWYKVVRFGTPRRGRLAPLHAGQGRRRGVEDSFGVQAVGAIEILDIAALAKALDPDESRRMITQIAADLTG